MLTRVILISLATWAWFTTPVVQGAILARLNAGEKLTLCAIGTSVTGNYYDHEKRAGVPSAWFGQLGQWLDELYPGQVALFNEGIGGAASKYTPTYTQANGASGLDFQLDRALAHEPDVLLIEFAVNDAFLGYGISRQMSRANLQAMIDRVNAWAAQRDKSVEIVLQTMNNNTHAGQRPELEAYYQGYRDVAQADGLLLIDHYPNWLKLYNSEPDHATWKSYVPDGIHPIAIGARRVILPEMQRALKAQLPAPAAESQSP